MVGGLGLALTILIGMMLFDFATGLMVAYVQKKISRGSAFRDYLKDIRCDSYRMRVHG